MASQKNATVVVIGGGLSGLMAAKLLNEQGVDAIVLEARDRVGGRTFTVQNPNCKYVDLGGAYVGPTQNRLLRLAKELGVQTYKINEVENLVHYKHGRSRKFKGAFPPMSSIFALMDFNNLFRTMDEYGKEIPADAPWKAPRAEEWDNMTMTQFFDKVIWTKSTRTFAEIFFNVNVTSQAYEGSLLWFLWYVKQCGGIDRIFSTTNGGQERKFVGGSQQLSIKVAALLGDKVKLNQPVSKIQQSESGVTVTTNTGNVFKADYVINASAPPLHMRIEHDPPLPPLRNQLIQRSPMGSVIKTMIYYKNPFWKENDMCGSAAIEDEEGPIGFCLDDTKPDGTFPCLMGFILADKARRLGELTKEERRDKIAKLYSKVFQNEAALYPVHYEEKNWAEEQWSGGCYTTMLPPGFLTKFGRELRKPIGRLYFAGTETATQWSGYMEGAIQAGERAAREIMFAMGKIRQDEIWQEEPESLEVPALPFEESFMERNLPSVPGFLRFLSVTSVLAAAASGAFIYQKYFK